MTASGSHVECRSVMAGMHGLSFQADLQFRCGEMSEVGDSAACADDELTSALANGKDHPVVQTSGPSPWLERPSTP